MKMLLALLFCAMMLATTVMAVTITNKTIIKCGNLHVWKYTYSDGTVSYSGKFARFIPWWVITGNIADCTEDPTYPAWKV